MRETCIVSGCFGKYHAHGMCNIHYCRDYYYRTYVKKIRPIKLCSIDGCGEKRRKHGLCKKHYYRSDIERSRKARRGESRRKQQRESYRLNCDAIKKRRRLFYINNRKKRIAQSVEWVRKNPGKGREFVARAKAAKLKATPKWKNQFFLEEIYDLACRRTKTLGFQWHVDHIVPLQSKLVCGLHCEQNLQVIPGSQNQSKSNRTWPDMP